MLLGAKGKHTQAIHRSPGGCTTKTHALADRACRLLAFLLTGAKLAARKARALLFEHLSACRIFLTDKGYDCDAIRRQIEATGATLNIPPKVNRRRKLCFSPMLYGVLTPSSE